MKKAIFITIILVFNGLWLLAQPIITPWGNIKGFVVDGEKMNFETSVRSVKTDWSGCISSERCNWQGNQTYSFSGKTTNMSHFLQALPLNYAEQFTEIGQNSVKVELSIDATAEIDQAGTYFCFEIPGSEFVDGTLAIYSGKSKSGSVNLKSSTPNGKAEYIRKKGNKIIVKTAKREYEVIAGNNTEIFVKQNFIDRPGYLNDPLPAKAFVASDPNQSIADYQVYFTLIQGKAKNGDKKKVSYTLNVKGTPDKEDVQMTIDAGKPGRPFDGVGSNYRVKDLGRDSMVVNYCLNNIRVAWSRIEFNWSEWQSGENENPLLKARAGKLSKAFYEQIEMARILAKRGLPIIVTVWAPPAWAIDTTRHNRQGLEHDSKLSLNSKKIDKMCQSIADYISYLKSDYGIEIPLFSFNEVDYGVMVYHTPEEHAFYTKELGKYFASRGLITKMMLGDTGAGTIRSNKMVIPAVEDPSIHPYIGAVAFHTWHGCTEADCKAWALSAQKLNVPLLVTEGGPNSALHRYPQYFLDNAFQLSEIDLYLRVCKYAQPISILEWQLTPDYSVLTGKGLYGDNGPLRPTQRFWNLKQLGSTPEGSFAIPIEVDKPNITATAFADILNGLYTIHIVNNSATREVTLTGIPEPVKSFNIYVTDATRGMEKVNTVKVTGGKVRFTIDAQAYTSLMTN
ncbi:MAG: hypothetical protein JZU47_12665 [Prolixibacteraceae bacterium]|nr:hypothetical protein [Prolixibacteraceae bacterium]